MLLFICYYPLFFTYYLLSFPLFLFLFSYHYYYTIIPWLFMLLHYFILQFNSGHIIVFLPYYLLFLIQFYFAFQSLINLLSPNLFIINIFRNYCANYCFFTSLFFIYYLFISFYYSLIIML